MSPFLSPNFLIKSSVPDLAIVQGWLACHSIHTDTIILNCNPYFFRLREF